MKTVLNIEKFNSGKIANYVNNALVINFRSTVTSLLLFYIIVVISMDYG